MIHIFEPSWFLLSGRENPLYDILFTSMANWLPRPIFKSKVSGNLWARSNKIFVKPKKNSRHIFITREERNCLEQRKLRWDWHTNIHVSFNAYLHGPASAEFQAWGTPNISISHILKGLLFTCYAGHLTYNRYHLHTRKFQRKILWQNLRLRSTDFISGKRLQTSLKFSLE